MICLAFSNALPVQPGRQLAAAYGVELFHQPRDVGHVADLIEHQQDRCAIDMLDEVVKEVRDHGREQELCGVLMTLLELQEEGGGLILEKEREGEVGVLQRVADVLDSEEAQIGA